MNKHEQSKADFRALSKSRRTVIAREARQFIRLTPGSADNSRYYGCLSARQVTELAHEIATNPLAR